jgi:uncharacterized protein (TIGR01777 family)
MKMAITGASGLVGRHTSDVLRAEGHEVRAVSARGVVRPEDFEACDAVVHLAGEPVAQRWTAAAKERIRSSRVDGTRHVVEALARLNTPPAVLVSASAIGIYGTRGEETLTESSMPAADFLGEVAVEWERAARAAEAFGTRVVTPRLGVVLTRDGGALEKMLPPFKLGVGGRIGDGKQWMSWIHIDDVVRLIEFAIRNESVRGPVNAVAPNPVTNAEFTRELARALHRPAIFPVPVFALKMLFGQMAEILYASQRVIPEAAICAGFGFKFAEVSAALRDLVS